MIAILAIAVLLAQSPPLYQSMPSVVFEITIDRFEQIVPVEVSCGEMSSDIVRVDPQPSPPSQAKFSFVPAAKGLAIRVDSHIPGKSIEAGGLLWEGKNLRWSWRTFARVDVGDGLKELRSYLARAVFVATLRDGRKIILNPKPVEGTVVVQRKGEGSLYGEGDLGTAFAHVQLEVEDVAGSKWLLQSKKPGIVDGMVGEEVLRIEISGTKCIVHQIHSSYEDLREKKRILKENNELKPHLTPGQLKQFLPECEALEKEIENLEKSTAQARLKAITSTLRLRLVDDSSGRLYGLFTLDIRN